MASVFKRKSDRIRKGSRWSIAYTNDAGRRCTRKAYTDKAESLRLANRLEDDAAKIRTGIIDVAEQQRAEHAKRAIPEHVDQYRAYLESKGGNSKHIRQTIAAIDRAIQSCGWNSIRDIAAVDMTEHLNRLREVDDLSSRSVNRHRGAVRSFATWLMKNHRLRSDPLTNLPLLNERTDRRLVRRALSDDELTRLFAATEHANMRFGLTGVDRAMLYRLAVGTGFRSGELQSLTSRAFHLVAQLLYRHRRSRL